MQDMQTHPNWATINWFMQMISLLQTELSATHPVALIPRNL
jgi:hypothetical protein